MLPAGDVLQALAQVLNTKPDFFFRSHSVNLQNVEFRKRSRLSGKDEASIRESAYDAVRRYVELEKLVQQEIRFVNPFAEKTHIGFERTGDCADRLRENWNLGDDALGNVLGILEDHGVKVIELEADGAFDGMAAMFDSHPVIVVNKEYPADRKRFTALHELGHLLFTFEDSLSLKDRERCCHRFAGSLLLPDATVKSLFGSRRSSIFKKELADIKQRYGISVQAIMQRLRDLEIISEPLFIAFRMQIQRDRNEKNYPYHGVESADRFRRLLLGAVSGEIISLSRAAELDNKSLSQFKHEYLAL
jgi:Zn-dependent peptidase ImmA (M78 family)